jgi:alpha-1,6-mannosyltransferase
MGRRQLLRLTIAAAAEIFCCVALNFFDDWTLEEMPVKFVTAAILGGIAYLFAVREFSFLTSRRSQVVIFWSVAVGLRLVMLPLEPSDDFWRYQWEGRIQRAGFNPYVLAPDNPGLEAIRTEFPAWHKINHREFRAIYPPGAELVFAGLSSMSDQPLFYKLLFTCADLETIALLILLLGGDSRYRGAAYYAWNPLVAYSFAGAAHFDSIMILPMLAAILFLARYEESQDTIRKWWLALLASICLGIAISIKLVPILLLLCCVFALGFRAITLSVSLAIPALLSTIYGYPKIDIWESLGRFAHVTRLNDLFWWLIEDTVWPNPHQKNYHYNVILLICVTLVSLLFCRNWKRGMIWVFGTALVLSPVLHPWYCTWILPLAAWRRAYAWFVFSVTLFAYFLFWNERIFLLPWHSEPWMRTIIIGPALVAAVLLGMRRAMPRGSGVME